MKDYNLQVILDKAILGNRNLIEIARDVIDGGGVCIQLRDKVSSDKTFFEEAKNLKILTKEKKCLLIVNDRVDIAIAADADGIHLGQGDLPYKEARIMLGSNKIIGISTHNLEQAQAAQAMGADYIGVGPIFATQTKPSFKPVGLDMVSAISKEIDIPAFFIGGINLKNVNEITKRGGRQIAVASAILNSDDITKMTKSFLSVIARRLEGPTKQSQNEIASVASLPRNDG